MVSQTERGDGFSNFKETAGLIVFLAATLVVPVALAQQNDSSTAPSLSHSSVTLDSVDQLYFHRNIPGNLDQSVSILDEMNSRDPGNPQILWRLGRSLMRMGERQTDKKEKLRFFDRAQVVIQQAVDKNPKFSESHFWLGVTMGRIGETRGILKSLFLLKPIKREMKKTLELDPSHGGAHRVLGEILRQTPGFVGGSKKGAVEEMEQAVTMGPRHTTNYVALAQAYLDYKQPEKARAVLNKVLEIKDPDDPGEYDEDIKDARRMLDGLEKKK